MGGNSTYNIVRISNNYWLYFCYLIFAIFEDAKEGFGNFFINVLYRYPVNRAYPALENNKYITDVQYIISPKKVFSPISKFPIQPKKTLNGLA